MTTVTNMLKFKDHTLRYLPTAHVTMTTYRKHQNLVPKTYRRRTNELSQIARIILNKLVVAI